jgi:peroxiredoxin
LKVSNEKNKSEKFYFIKIFLSFCFMMSVSCDGGVVLLCNHGIYILDYILAVATLATTLKVLSLRGEEIISQTLKFFPSTDNSICSILHTKLLLQTSHTHASVHCGQHDVPESVFIFTLP